MINGAKVLAVIPARGGSKGVPGKNLRPVAGKPLIAWTIDAAQRASLLDMVIVSSDDQKIIDVARAFGCDVPFVRDGQLAQDATPTIDVVMDALVRCPGYEWVVLLQPTSPLRTAQDIDGAIEACISNRAPSCVSVTLAQESPYWMFTLNKGNALEPLLPELTATRRQDLPVVYSLNGAIYVANTRWLLGEGKFIGRETVAYVMPTERSVDIDTELDLLNLQHLMESK